MFVDILKLSLLNKKLICENKILPRNSASQPCMTGKTSCNKMFLNVNDPIHRFYSGCFWGQVYAAKLKLTKILDWTIFWLSYCNPRKISSISKLTKQRTSGVGLILYCSSSGSLDYTQQITRSGKKVLEYSKYQSANS